MARLAQDRLFKLQASKLQFNTRSLVEFIPQVSPDLKPPYHLLPFVRLLEAACDPGGIRAVLAAPPQHGKDLDCETPMLTGRGWIKAGEVVEGDNLAGSDGNWTKVIGVFPQGEVPLFRVDFTDCSSLVTGAGHLWQVHNRYSGNPTIKTTEQLSSDLTESDKRCKWRLPIVKAVTGTPRGLPIDAYWLGLWLGDGTSRTTAITTMDPEVESYIRNYASAQGLRVSVQSKPDNRASTYAIVSDDNKNPLFASLKALGLVQNKHVPEQYLTADIDTRLAIVQGLCDTDGTVARNGSQQSFSSTSKALATGFRTLVASLGGVCGEYSRPAANKVSYTIYFRLPDGMAGFRLARKQNRLTSYTPRHEPRRFVKSITPVGSGQSVCFSVAAPDSLFCAGPDLVLTHNSVTLLHGLLWLCIKYPKMSHAYVTYATDRAETVSKQFTELAEAAGMEPKGRLSDIVLKGGSTVKFTSIGGVLTGYPVTGLLIIDDPVKDRADAESPTLRRKAAEWFIDVARSRRHPKTSIICMATRWHPEDLSGELLKKLDKYGNHTYQYLNFKAISEGATDDDGIVIGDPLGRKPGQALFPELKDVDFFDEERLDEYSWQSLYQGEPRGRGNTVFQWPDMGILDSNEVDEQGRPLGKPLCLFYGNHWPDDYDQISIGLDFAYTAKTSADYSAAVILGKFKNKPEIHVIDTLRLQVEPREFRDRVRLLLATYPKATATCYVAATEKGGVEFFREGGMNIDGLIAKADKFMRAVPTSAAWNSRQFKLPARAPWKDTFLNEICSFTGLKDAHDDLVDAFAAAYDGFGAPPATYRPQIHTRIVGDMAEIGLG